VGLINWIFDFYQQYRIDQLRDEAAQARAQAAAVRSIDTEDGRADGRAPVR
jgi:hypothetical protein